MNKRTIAKATIDAAMAVLFLLLMNTAVTGIPLHEILGAAILALFAAHLSLNRKWLGNITRRVKQGASKKQMGGLVLNTAIALSMSTCIVTGVMISQYLFAPLGQGSSTLWYDVHDISAWVSLSLLVLHGVLHWRWIAGVLRQIAAQTGRAAAFAARAGTGLLAAGAVLSLFTTSPVDRLLPSSSGTGVSLISDSAEESVIAVQTSSPKPDAQTVTATAESQNDAVSLEEYLSKLYCTGCHDRCPLTHPRCRRGQEQAERATQEYNESVASA